jgi:O-antigen/teichoic acid export membrane protein
MPFAGISAGRRQTTAEGVFGRLPTGELKHQSVRGGGVAIIAQGLMFVLQTGSTMALARLLSPADFGLQGMVLAMTGFLTMFRDAGLSVASVQREVLTHEQTSTLFWINVAVGALLTAATAVLAPFLVGFYREPRLFYVTIISAAAFLFNSLAVQHRALLNRSMQFVTLAKIDITALAVSVTVGVAMAASGFGYWALVAMAVTGPMVSAAAVWTAMPWLPGRPRRGSGVRSMIKMGGTVTLNSLVMYVAYNTEKILLGRSWGAEALGLYGRAFQLANLPLQQLNSSISTVALPALSRIQGESERLRGSFLKGYSVIISLTIPVAFACGVFAEEIVGVLLGPKWTGAATVLRLLVPTVLALALINPFGWLLQAIGQVGRSLNIALLITPVVIGGIAVGLRYGPPGVALGYSTAMMLLVWPVVVWSKRGTGLTGADYWNSIKRPMASGALATAAGWLVKFAFAAVLAPLPLLVLGLALSGGTYLLVLLIVMGEKELYADLLSNIISRSHSLKSGGAAVSVERVRA